MLSAMDALKRKEQEAARATRPIARLQIKSFLMNGLICAVVFAACSFVAYCSPTCVNQQAGGRRGSQGATPHEDLSTTFHRFLELIETGETRQLPDFWSNSGVTFGVDGALIGRRQVITQLQKKLDLYCFFFDTACLRKQDDEKRRAAKAPPRKNPLYSYRDLLRAAKSREFKVSQGRDADVLVGHVQVILTSGENVEGDKRKILEFIFANENGKWKLTSVPYE